MSSIARKIKRSTKQGRAAFKARRKTEIDAINDREYEAARDAGQTHFRQLHPTKGWLTVSFAKMEMCAGNGKFEMSRIIGAVIGRARKHAQAIGFTA